MNIKIEPLSIDHAKYSWHHKNDNSLWMYMESDVDLPCSIEKEIDCIKNILNRNDEVAFSIVANDNYVGVVKLKNIILGACELSYYMYNKDYRNKGICSEATSQVIDYAFDVLGVDVICRYVHVNNLASYKMTRKQGFYVVGMSFEKDNVVRFEINKTRWKALK